MTAEQDGQRALRLRVLHETNIEVRLRRPFGQAARTETVSKIHLFADLPQPFTDEACRHSAGVVRVGARLADAGAEPP